MHFLFYSYYRLTPLSLTFLAVFVCYLLSCHCVRASEYTSIEQDSNSWVNLHTFKKLDDNWKVNISADLRFVDDSSELRRSRARTAIFYSPSEWRFAMGYDHIRTLEPRSFENRLWQEASYAFELNSDIAVDVRLRQEQRFFSFLDDTIWRTRLRINGIFNIFEDQQWYLRSWNEVFLNLNPESTPGQGHFSQYRMFAGVGHRKSESLRMEAGYQMRYYSRSDREDRIDHILFLQAYLYW